MKVLVLGMSRAGTTSLWLALQRLGFHPYHSRDLFANKDHDLPLWTGLMAPKSARVSRRIDRSEFDEIFARFDAVTDLPAILFARELLLAYPEAKVILNKRDVDGWYESMSKTILTIMSWRFLGPAKPTYEFFRQACNILFNDDWSAESIKSSFHQYYQLVKTLASKRELLEIDLGDGWEPICDFLDVAVPDEKYPTAYNSHQFLDFHKQIWWSSLMSYLFRWACMTGLVCILLGFAFSFAR